MHTFCRTIRTIRIAPKLTPRFIPRTQAQARFMSSSSKSSLSAVSAVSTPWTMTQSTKLIKWLPVCKRKGRPVFKTWEDISNPPDILVLVDREDCKGGEISIKEWTTDPISCTFAGDTLSAGSVGNHIQIHNIIPGTIRRFGNICTPRDGRLWSYSLFNSPPATPESISIQLFQKPGVVSVVTSVPGASAPDNRSITVAYGFLQQQASGFHETHFQLTFSDASSGKDEKKLPVSDELSISNEFDEFDKYLKNVDEFYKLTILKHITERNFVLQQLDAWKKLMWTPHTGSDASDADVMKLIKNYCLTNYRLRKSADLVEAGWLILKSNPVLAEEWLKCLKTSSPRNVYWNGPLQEIARQLERNALYSKGHVAEIYSCLLLGEDPRVYFTYHLKIHLQCGEQSFAKCSIPVLLDALDGRKYLPTLEGYLNSPL